MGRKVIVAMMLLASLLASVSVVQAVATSIGLLRISWNHDNITVYISLQKDVDPSYKDEIIKAFTDWSAALKSASENSEAFNFVFLDVPQSEKRPADITVAVKKNTGTVLGSASVTSSRGNIQQVKITLAAYNALGLPLEKSDVRTIARHEIGHAIGLGHSNDDGREPLDLMAPTYDFVQIGYDIYPSSLNLNAVIFIYGNDGFGGTNLSPIPSTYHKSVSSSQRLLKQGKYDGFQKSQREQSKK